MSSAALIVRQISDRVSKGESTDLSGPAMVDALTQLKSTNIVVVATAVVPDEVEQIQRVVKQWADADVVDLVLTSGGTGFSPRDVTPEAIKVRSFSVKVEPFFLTLDCEYWY